MKFPVFIVLLTFLCLSCKKETILTPSSKTIIKYNHQKDGFYNVQDSLQKLFQTALTADSLNFDNWEPFIVFKSGNFISEKAKNIFIARMINDSILKVELYSMDSKKWTKSDDLQFPKAQIIQFDLRINDYNFDGYNDLYIQQSASNGFSISKGFLITIDPVTLQMTYHREARELGNMRPDPKERIVYSDKYHECPYVKGEPCVTTHKWKTGKLTTIKTICPECDELR